MSTKNDLIGKAINLKELIDYQTGSVISREVLKKDSGSITIFAFDENEGLSEHTAPFDAFVQIIDGEAEITISGTPHIVKQGEFITMPAHKPHALRGITAFKMMLVMLRTPVDKT